MKDERTGLDVASVGDAEGVAALVGLDAPTADASLEALGRIVRAAWVEVAKKEAKTVPGYVDLWKWLEIPDADTDRKIGEQVVRAVDASRPAAPEVDAEDLWTDYRTGRGTVFASDRKAFLAGVAAGRRTREPDMGAADASRPGLTGDAWTALAQVIATLAENDSLVDDAIAAAERAGCPDATVLHLHEINDAMYRRRLRGSRPGLTEEQADAIALGCLQVREDLQRHAIKRAILRVDRGETGPATEPTRAERVAEAQRLRAEARAEAEACTVPMPADLLARYPRSADPPQPDRPSGLTRAMHDAAQQRPSVAPDLYVRKVAELRGLLADEGKRANAEKARADRLARDALALGKVARITLKGHGYYGFRTARYGEADALRARARRHGGKDGESK